MANSPQDNFIRCHAALHALLSHTIPSLQHAIDTWHQKIAATTHPCSNPAQCPPYKKPSTKNKSCPNCIAWATAIEAQVYPPSAVGSLQWMNANSVVFCKDPLEVIKLFVLRMPANQKNAYSSLGDFDTASLLMIMGKFIAFHNGDHAVFDIIQKVAQIRNSLAHMKHTQNLKLDDQTFNNYWMDVTNLVNSLPGLGHPYFTNKTAQDVISELTKIKDQSIPATIQEEALKPLVEDIVLKTIKDNIPNFAPKPQELSTNPSTWQKQLKGLYRSKRSGIGFLPGSNEEFPSDEFFVDLQLAQEQKTPTKVKHVELTTYTDLLSICDDKGHILKHVLVSGVAGMGKTTMMSRLAYQWACAKVQNSNMEADATAPKQGKKKRNWFSLLKKSKSKKMQPSTPAETTSVEPTGSNHLHVFEQVFLLDLRQIAPEMDLLETICSQLLGNISRQKLEEYLMENADKCLFLLDGFDELGTDVKVLNTPLLYNSHVIVTTRPNKVAKFYEIQQDYIQVNLEGFSREGIDKYVCKFFHDPTQPSQTSAPLSQIRSNYVTKNLIHMPLLLGMICLIWKDQQSLPKTVSNLYHLVIEFLLRHWKAREADFTDLSLKKFKDHIGFDHVMVTIGKTALHGLMNDSKLVFQEDEFDSAEVVKQGCSLGIISSESKITGFDRITYVSFIHKTFQEYSAALYLASVAGTDESLFKQFLSQMDFDDMEYVLRFCCGESQKAAELILPYIVDEPKDDTRKKGVIWDKHDSCRLLLILLFEVESTFGVKRSLHIILRPIFHTITLYVRSMSSYKIMYDPVYLAALQYFVSYFETQHEWTKHVKVVKINTDESLDVQGTNDLFEIKMELLGKMLESNKITLCVIYSEEDLDALNESFHRLPGPVDELTLTEPVSVNTIHSYLQKTLHPIRLHLAGLEILYFDETNPETFANLLQMIHKRSGSIKGIEVWKCSGMDRVIKYVAPFYSMLECIKFMYVDLSQEGADTMCEDILQAGKIINIQGSSCTHEDMRNISPAHTIHLPLQELTLVKVDLSSAVSKLCCATVFLGNLHKLVLWHCYISEEGVQELSSHLSNLANLQDIDLSGNTIGGSLSTVIQGINKCKIRKLNLGSSKLTDESRNALSQMQLPLLEDINLKGNGIDSSNVEALSVSLKQMPKLRRLDLGGNMLGCQGVTALCESFQYITQLERINLDRNGIGCDGVKSLASALQYTTRLECLYLSHNPISTDGAKSLASALRLNKSLRHLGLCSNQIQSAGVASLRSVSQSADRHVDIWFYDPRYSQLGTSTINISVMQIEPSILWP